MVETLKNPGNIKVFTAGEQSEGGGARVLRGFPGPNLSHVDPFVLVDEFFVETSAGFPEHPHRGFEAVTYMLEGGFKHKDSSGNEETVEAGGLQRITMGSGIRHSEMPTGGRAHGIQLWVNLPQELKEVDPEYEVVPGKQLSGRGEETGEKLLIDDSIGPELKTSIRYVDVELDDSEFSWNIGEDEKGFIYTIAGKGTLETEGETLELSKGKVAVNDSGETSKAKVKTREELKFVSLAGAPHGEPINQHGSFVD